MQIIKLNKCILLNSDVGLYGIISDEMANIDLQIIYYKMMENGGHGIERFMLFERKRQRAL